MNMSVMKSREVLGEDTAKLDLHNKKKLETTSSLWEKSKTGRAALKRLTREDIQLKPSSVVPLAHRSVSLSKDIVKDLVEGKSEKKSSVRQVKAQSKRLAGKLSARRGVDSLSMGLGAQPPHPGKVQMLLALRTTSAYLNMCLYIETHKEVWRGAVEKSGKNLYVRSNSSLSRSVQYNFDHTIFVHFVKKRLKDKVLGEGGFKCVKTALCYNTGELFASVGLGKKCEGELEKMTLVAGLEGFIQPLYCVSYLDKYENFPKKRIIMKLCEKGNLSQLLKERRLSKGDFWRIASQLLSSLNQLHARKLIHRDLKPANIVLSQGAHGSLKAYICDLASLCTFESDERQEYRTTCWYVPPECAKAHLEDEAHAKITSAKNFDVIPSFSAVVTDKLDVWSLGLILYQMFFNRRTSWMEASSDDKVVLKLVADLTERWFIEPKRGSIEHLIWAMLRINPRERLTASQAFVTLGALLEEEKKIP